MEAQGKPSPDELALLEPLRGKVPDEVFGEPFVPPVATAPARTATLLRRADELLREAGCKREGTSEGCRTASRSRSSSSTSRPRLQPHTASFLPNLKLVGIEARSRIVDAAQYQRRVGRVRLRRRHPAHGMGMTPDEGLRSMFGSRTATVEGSSNIAGVRDPAVDTLIKRGADRRHPRRTRHRVPGAGPGAARRALLDPHVVQGRPLAGILGHVRPPGREAAL